MFVIRIIICVLSAVVVGVGLFYQCKSNVVEMIARLIALAEETGFPGEKKMAYVVSELASHIPAAFRKVLNDEALQEIAQYVFDWMRRYANEYLERSKGKTDSEKTEIGKNVAELAMNELISELVGLPIEMLEEKARECGIDVQDIADKEQIAAMIVCAMIQGVSGS